MLIKWKINISDRDPQNRQVEQSGKFQLSIKTKNTIHFLGSRFIFIINRKCIQIGLFILQK